MSETIFRRLFTLSYALIYLTHSLKFLRGRSQIQKWYRWLVSSDRTRRADIYIEAYIGRTFQRVSKTVESMWHIRPKFRTLRTPSSVFCHGIPLVERSDRFRLVQLMELYQNMLAPYPDQFDPSPLDGVYGSM